jgi:predicted acylesterase/phospholipase RssA
MMHSLAANGISADMVVGSSVGALNGAYYAGDPTLRGVLQLETIWRGLQRRDVFPVTWRTLLGFLWRRDFLISHDGIEKLIDDHLPYRNLQDGQLPVHIVATDIISGDSVVLSEGPAAQAIIASTAIPGAFAPVRYKDFYLADGAISSNTPIKVAVAKGAQRLIILPTGYACAADRRRRHRAACADPVDRAAIGQRAGRSRPRDRILRRAAALPAGGVALRLLADIGSYRARDREHRRVAGARRPAKKRDSRRDAPAHPLIGRNLCLLKSCMKSCPVRLHCKKRVRLMMASGTH